MPLNGEKNALKGSAQCPQQGLRNPGWAHHDSPVGRRATRKHENQAPRRAGMASQQKDLS